MTKDEQQRLLEEVLPHVPGTLHRWVEYAWTHNETGVQKKVLYPADDPTEWRAQSRIRGEFMYPWVDE